MRARLTLIGAVLALVTAPAVALAADPPEPAFGGPLNGAQEVPAVVTAATGEGTAVISPDGSTITYVVTYTGLSGAVAAAHIHTGAVGVAGGVILPLTAGTSPMTGTLTAADFSASGSVTTFAEAVAAIQAGDTYFNLHTGANPGGEIRGQIGVTVDAPAPTTAPPTSTLGVQPASDGGSAVPATIAIVAFLALALVAAGRFEQRRRR